MNETHALAQNTITKNHDSVAKANSAATHTSTTKVANNDKKVDDLKEGEKKVHEDRTHIKEEIKK